MFKEKVVGTTFTKNVASMFNVEKIKKYKFDARIVSEDNEFDPDAKKVEIKLNEKVIKVGYLSKNSFFYKFYQGRRNLNISCILEYTPLSLSSKEYNDKYELLIDAKTAYSNVF